MALSDDPIATLQTHNHQLHDYFTKWINEQQELLQNISIPSISPGSDTCVQQGNLADTMTTEGASHIVAPASTDECEIAALQEGQIVTNPELKETAGELADSDTCQKQPLPPNTLGMTRAGQAQAMAQSQTDNGELGPVARHRDAIVTKFQASVNILRTMPNPHKQDILVWVNTTLNALEELTNSDTFADMPDADPAASPTEHISAALTEELAPVAPGTKRQKCGDIVRSVAGSKKFEFASAVVILFNAIVMGISADYKIKNPEAPEESFLEIAEKVFFSYYTIELLIRFIDQGKTFLIGEDFKWNLFDFGLVLLSAYDQLEPLFMSGGGSPVANVSFLRLLRLLKMAKLLRMFRLMKSFKQLRLILASVLGSMQAMFWAGVLVLLICYMTSILFLNLCTTFLSDAAANNLEINSDIQSGIEDYWGSVAKGMTSLFGACTGGDDWFNVAAPLLGVGWACYCLFLLYMGFFLIVIFNTFSSLFVQSVLDNSDKDAAAVIEAELEKKHEYIEELQDFYDQIDEDGDGLISMAEFVRHADDPKLYAWASHLDIDLTDAEQFFQVLSSNGTEPVDIDAFVVGCIKLKGAAKSVDLMAVYHLTKLIHDRSEETHLLLHSASRREKKFQATTIEAMASLQAKALQERSASRHFGL